MSEALRANPGPAATAWHAVSADQVVSRLKTDPAAGLDANEASQRLAQYGFNRLPEGKQRGPLMRFLAQLNNILVYVLLGAGFVKLMVGLWLDAAVILGVVIINALLGFIQKARRRRPWIRSATCFPRRRGPYEAARPV
jgi:magnesium-transporting ATPase (P-type)